MSRELLQQALDVIIEMYNERDEVCERTKNLYVAADETIAALEAELAKPEQEIDNQNPAAWHWYSLYKAKCQEFHDKQTMLGTEIVALEEELAELKEQQIEQESIEHAVIAGVLFDFMGWLTSRQERLVLSASDEASPAVKVIEEFAKMRGLSLDDAKVKDWQDALAQHEQESEAYGYAKRLAEFIWAKHYKEESPDWTPLPSVLGVLTQIDNMTCGLELAKPEMPTKIFGPNLEQILNAAGFYRREWVGLTGDERRLLNDKQLPIGLLIEIVESKLRDKNT